MLDCVRQTLRDVCWLCDSQRKIALRPMAWAPRPSVGQPNFYAPQFALDQSTSPWLVGEEVALPDLASPESLRPQEHRPADRARFMAVHGEIIKAIQAGRLKKVVPFAREDWVFQEPLAYWMWPQAFAPVPDHFSFGFQFGNEGFCGVTPELLFHVQGGKLTTMALAGTGEKNGPSLLDNKKERHEHDLVIQHIVAMISDLGAVEVGNTVEKKYPRLKHLYTPISVELSRTPEFSDLVARLHPTAALGGYPRAEALEFLRQHGGERGRFGAPFGFQNADEMLCVVAIRALQWRGNVATLMSGCGVVEGSDADREWRELKLKREATAHGLGLTWL